MPTRTSAVPAGSAVGPPASDAAELALGLLAEPASISPKYLYDDLGCKLFEAICLLPEYYLTRLEASIVAANIGSIGKLAGPSPTLIDLGAGNCAKAAALIPRLVPRHYVPVDIAGDFLRESALALRKRFPMLDVVPIVEDFSHHLQLPACIPLTRRLFFYPGSSIGNFSPAGALSLLRHIREQCGPDGGLLLGVDLIKDEHVLRHAYDDGLGLTAAFNLNILRRSNELLGSDFDVHDWMHQIDYNTTEQRIEMHLCARRAVTVRWPDGERRFRLGERIHTENSYKFSLPGIEQLLNGARFRMTRAWTDAESWFAVIHARAA